MPLPLDPETLRLARIVWDYHHLGHELRPAGCILALGSHDTRVAERAAELYLDGWAPLLICSGGLGRLTEGMWDRPEADIFADVAERMGAPRERILVENRSTNTGDNIERTQALLAERGLDPDTVIVVQKPYMERRAYATAKKHWPDKEIIVTSPQYAFADYPNGEISMEEIIHIMVGDLQRVRLYAEKGYQIPQEIPDAVWDAYKRLVARGFNHHLIDE